MEMLRQLFYLSRAGAALTDMDVQKILRASQRNNRQKDITGCLLCTGKHFAQVLEGTPAVVDELVARIATDKRHTDFVVIIDHVVNIRKFPAWSMGILYKFEITDRVEAILNGERPSSEVAFELLSEMSPDSVMGTL